MTGGQQYTIIVTRERVSHDPERWQWFYYCHHPDCKTKSAGYRDRAEAYRPASEHALRHPGTPFITEQDVPVE